LNWVEVSLELQADLAEPAAELLSRVAPNGVAIELVDERARVRAWLPDDSELADRRQQLDEGFWHLSQIQPFPEPDFKVIEDESWEVAWKKQYQPIQIGEKLQILPSWIKQEDKARIPIYLQPGMAFGTGAHTTTRHCLEALELLVIEGDSIADLGCGSGILGIAAARLGAGRVVALDTDPQAVKLALENVERNGVAKQVQVLRGSLTELQVEDPSLGFDLIVANIRAAVLEAFIEGGLSNHLAPNGRLVMSGILAEQLDSLVETARTDDLQVERTLDSGDWRSVIFERS
jgi:ribosomal protein L11 methyltransferase